MCAQQTRDLFTIAKLLLYFIYIFYSGQFQWAAIALLAAHLWWINICVRVWQWTDGLIFLRAVCTVYTENFDKTSNKKHFQKIVMMFFFWSTSYSQCT